MSMVQEKMYMDVDDVCAILGVSKAYKLFILSGKLDLKKSYSTFEGCVFSLK